MCESGSRNFGPELFGAQTRSSVFGAREGLDSMPSEIRHHGFATRPARSGWS
jgi:hypothetical protein